jgi:GMP synthase-like glutamine amidotransferase
MKPVAICRFAPQEGPGYFATYLGIHGIPWRLVKVDEGEMLPEASTFSGLAMMGGAMSANDDLPWIAPMLDLIRRAVTNGTPVIGHCLGGQLLARALGGAVRSNPVKEIGWGEIELVNGKAGAEWGPPAAFTSFHWHGETFSIPPGAVRIWASVYCPNQAFIYRNSIGMQCHIEMTAELVQTWCDGGAQEIEEALGVSPAVQSAEAMRQDLPAKLEGLHRVADAVYGRWMRGLRSLEPPHLR